MATHAAAAGGILSLPVGASAKALLLVALAAHAWWRRPARPARVVRSREGFWALPDARCAGLRLDTATRFGVWWAELHLVGGRARARVLLLKDQLSPEAWRQLQAALRWDVGEEA